MATSPAELLHRARRFLVEELWREDFGARRLTGALGAYYASPVAAGGHLYFMSEGGAIAVLPPGGDLTPLIVNDLGEDMYATPAFVDGHIYVRTVEALYAFGEK